MILVVVIFLMFAFIALGFLNDGLWNKDWVCILSVVGGVISAIVIVLMTVIVICININADADKAGFQRHYESLVYQLENNLYDNDNDVGKKELYNQITNWNCDLARRKVLSKNPWVGIFWADIYDDFEFIAMEME